MRHWLLILMIALLPLRGWAGDAMALGSGVASASVQEAAPCHGEHAAMAPVLWMDAHHGATFADDTTAGADTGTKPAHNTCTACDICNVPAMVLAAHSTRTAPPAYTLTAPASERFASALPQRGSKPPIA